ncbi:Arm DNA-binding domain-containing protein [Sphingomonas sp. 1P08PE]|uniref:Arm DNA-binding domain-containing protein n=1 Tax=Sphingomonas sp. 1P08PE TaxID=554122 RepID=UPI0039A396EB
MLVRASGSKLWRFKYWFAGKEKLLAFGVYPAAALLLHGCGVPRRRWRPDRTGSPVPRMRRQRS